MKLSGFLEWLSRITFSPRSRAAAITRSSAWRLVLPCSGWFIGDVPSYGSAPEKVTLFGVAPASRIALLHGMRTALKPRSRTWRSMLR